MKSFRFIAMAILMLGSTAAFAQGTDVAIWGSVAQFGAQDIEDPDFDVSLEFESGIGFAASANWFWGDHFSTELMGMVIDVDSSLEIAIPGEEEFESELGSFELTPIMFTGQWHFAPDSRIDPYIGIGAAYVMIDDLAISDESTLEVVNVEIDDEFTFLANAGLGIAFTPGFGMNIDVRYIPLEPASFAEGDPEELDLELNPIIFSVGLRWRFGS